MDTDFERELADTVQASPDRWRMVDPVLRQRVYAIHDWLAETPPPTTTGTWLLVRGVGEPRWLALTDGFCVGRTDTSDLVVKNAWISSRHCRFVAQGEDWLLYDLESSNGTYVNGNRQTRYVLREGDVIQLNELRLLFIRTDESDTKTAAP